MRRRRGKGCSFLSLSLSFAKKGLTRIRAFFAQKKFAKDAGFYFFLVFMIALLTQSLVGREERRRLRRAAKSCFLGQLDGQDDKVDERGEDGRPAAGQPPAR